MTSDMPFPPRARKSAGIVKEGHEHLQETSEIIHQHRFSLASQIRAFDARWANLFNLAPILNKLTKGRQMPTEFRDNAQVLLDDVQHALHDAHSRKLPKIPEEGSNIIPGPPPPVPISDRQPRSLASWRRRQLESQDPTEKQSIVVRIRSKLKRKKAVKRKGSKKGPLSRFNPFRSKPAPLPSSPLPPITTTQLPPIQHGESWYTTRSGRSSSNSRKNSNQSKRKGFPEPTEPQKPVPPLVEQEWKPHLPPPPNFSPMKLDISSIGHYSPTLSKPILHQPPPWPGVGIVNPSVTPSSPQPYYLSMQDQKVRDKEMRREKRDKRKSSSSREHGGREHKSREHKSREDDRSRRRHKHHHRSHDYTSSDMSREERREVDKSRRHDDHRHHHRRDSRDDDHRRRERERDSSDSRHTSARRTHRYHYDDTSRRERGSKRSSFAHRYPSPGYPTSYTHAVYQPMLPQVVERSRFQENFSVIS